LQALTQEHQTKQVKEVAQHGLPDWNEKMKLTNRSGQMLHAAQATLLTIHA
jgi:hypothetical protein